jgi:hypothetical protein
MVYFQTKNPNLGKFLMALYWKMLIYTKLPFVIFYGHLGYFMTIWYILCSFGIFYDHLVYIMFIWYIFSSFGIMCIENSGNPDSDDSEAKQNRSIGDPKDYAKSGGSFFSRGRCYDHNFGRFLQIFGEKNGVFSQNQCYDQILAKIAVV